MNTHELLKDYHGHPDYPEIAQYAAYGAKEGGTEKSILKAVSSRWGNQNYLQMKGKAVPMKVFGELGNHIPENALDQMETALRIPPAIRGALMPDAHYGYSVPIGAVVELDNAISPAYIGYDISCMVMLSIFEMDADDFLSDKKSLATVLRQVTRFGIGSEFDRPHDHDVLEDSRWNITKILKTLYPKAVKQLGSSGGGNHFADLCVGTVLNEEIPWLPDMSKDERFVALMTHSGSRGAGHKIATHYVKLAEDEMKYKARGIPKGYGWLDMNTDVGEEYWMTMHLMGDYALANHELIHKSFARRTGLSTRAQYWNRHNYAWDNKGKIVHRKGATPAELNTPGIVPGTSGTLSYLTDGLGNAESMFSSSHGAGRPYSRTEAKRRHNKDKFDARMEDIIHYGLAADETFMAYKDIEEVLSVQDGVLLERVASLQPKVVIMGGKR